MFPWCLLTRDDLDAVVAQVALSAEEAGGGGGRLVHSYVDFHRDPSENRRLESCALFEAVRSSNGLRAQSLPQFWNLWPKLQMRPCLFGLFRPFLEVYEMKIEKEQTDNYYSCVEFRDATNYPAKMCP